MPPNIVANLPSFHGVNDPPALVPVRALLFDTFGTVVDWRGSLLADVADFGRRRGIAADWTRLVDGWSADDDPSMDRVRRGGQPWTTLDGLHRQSLERLVMEMGFRNDLTDGHLSELTQLWHWLRPWPDAVEALRRLKTRCFVAPLSNGNFSLMTNLAKHAGLPWDAVFGADLFGHYKPDPETYLGACRLLDLAPGEVMMVAAHQYDLRAARALGLATAFFPRPTEYGPRQEEKDLDAEEPWTVVAHDLRDLASLLGT